MTIRTILDDPQTRHDFSIGDFVFHVNGPYEKVRGGSREATLPPSFHSSCDAQQQGFYPHPHHASLVRAICRDYQFLLSYIRNAPSPTRGTSRQDYPGFPNAVGRG